MQKKSRMKKLIAVIGLLLYTFLAQAQIDSFMVKGRNFKFPIPSDWVFEEKSDGIQNDSSWNTIIRYSVDKPNLNSRLGIKFERRPNNDPSYDKLPKKLAVYSDYIEVAGEKGGWISTEYPTGNCSDCIKQFTTTEVFYLNDQLDIIFTFFAKCKTAEKDSLLRTFQPFVKQFFELNRKPVASFRQLMITRNAVDSFYLPGKNCRLMYDTTWKLFTQKDSLGPNALRFKLTKIVNGKEISVYLDLLPNYVRKLPPPQKLSLFETPSISYHSTNLELPKDTNFRLKPTITGHTLPAEFPRSGSTPFCYPSNFYCPSLITYDVYPDSDSLKGYRLRFALCMNNYVDDPLLHFYYEEMLENFIKDFLDLNHASWPYEYNNGILSNTPTQLAPLMKKTKVE